MSRGRIGDNGTMGIAETPLLNSDVGLIDGLTTTRAIRRYLNEPVPDEVLRTICFAATRAPSGSNRQPFRLIVLTDGPVAAAAKALIADGAREIWSAKRDRDRYDEGSGSTDDSPKARMARTMEEFVDGFESIPVVVLPCLLSAVEPGFREGASVFPACQNLLLAARALGYGGVLTGWHHPVADRLRELLNLPDNAHLAATITLGRVAGRHGPVRRLPLDQLIYGDDWGDAPDWAVDPPGTRHTTAGPPGTRQRQGL